MEKKIMEKINTIYQSFSEVYDIILHMEERIYHKIPKTLIAFIEKNRDLRIYHKYRLF